MARLPARFAPERPSAAFKKMQAVGSAGHHYSIRLLRPPGRAEAEGAPPGYRVDEYVACAAACHVNTALHCIECKLIVFFCCKLVKTYFPSNLDRVRHFFVSSSELLTRVAQRTH